MRQTLPWSISPYCPLNVRFLAKGRLGFSAVRRETLHSACPARSEPVLQVLGALVELPRGLGPLSPVFLMLLVCAVNSPSETHLPSSFKVRCRVLVRVHFSPDLQRPGGGAVFPTHDSSCVSLPPSFEAFPHAARFGFGQRFSGALRHRIGLRFTSGSMTLPPLETLKVFECCKGRVVGRVQLLSSFFLPLPWLVHGSFTAAVPRQRVFVR